MSGKEFAFPSGNGKLPALRKRKEKRFGQEGDVRTLLERGRIRASAVPAAMIPVSY
jgi:hypothetical protein